VTDRLTDRILIARPRLHSMQCGKNLASFLTVGSCNYSNVAQWKEIGF